MKLVIPLVILIVLVAAAALALGLGGCNDSSPPAAAPAVAVATDPVAALDELVRVYRERPAFQEATRFTYVTPEFQTTRDLAIRIDDADRVRLDLPDSLMVITNERIVMTLDSTTHKYIEIPAAENPDASFRKMTSAPLVPLQLALRYAPDRAAHLHALVFGHLQNPRVESVQSVSREGGAVVREMVIRGDNGSGRVFIDPGTGLVTGSRLEFSPPGRAGQQWTMTMAITEEPVDASVPIELDTTGRLRVDSMQALKQATVGEVAADLVLPSLGGETVTLHEQRGSVVVLDFWATWCRPCKQGLPLLDEFHRWAEKSGRPIRVFAVNVWERHETDEQKRNAVENYWKDTGFAVPALLDLTGNSTVAFGFRSIPTTIVIAPDGTIANIHTGYDPKMADTLKAETLELLDDA